MKNLVINVSFIPNLNAGQYTLPLAEEVFYGPGLRKVGWVVYEGALTGRPHVVIDENATEEEVQDMTEWVRGVMSKVAS